MVSNEGKTEIKGKEKFNLQFRAKREKEKRL